MQKLNYRENKEWKSEDVTFLRSNYGKLPIQDLANTLRRSYRSISHKAHRLHLDSRHTWTEMENELILENYWCNPNVWDLLPDRSRAAVKVQARKLGATRKCGNYAVNFRFFEEWTPESAYLIGFFLADGCIEHRLNRVSCELSMKDYDHLVMIRNLMGSQNPICVKKTRNSCALFIHNLKMVRDIMDKGVLPNKTHRTKLPGAPPHLMRDVIRGIFDGDGSIYSESKTGRVFVQFLGSLPLVSDIQNYLSENLDVGIKTLSRHNKGSDACYRLAYGGRSELVNVLEFLYYSDCICLLRKQALARGVIPGIINTAQISQSQNSVLTEPEGKSEDLPHISPQRLNAVLPDEIRDGGIVQ